MQSLPEIPKLTILEHLLVRDLVNTCLSSPVWHNFCLRQETRSLLADRIPEMEEEFIQASNEAMRDHREPDLSYFKFLLDFGVQPQLVIGHVIDHEQPRLLDLILEYPIDVNQEDFLGTTLLNHACSIGNLEMVSSLLRKGADPNLMDSLGYLSLIFAVDHRSYEMTVALIQAGADPNLPDRHGIWAIMLVEDPRIQEYLLASGADPNVIDPVGGYTPLMYAVILQNLKLVQSLIQYGANVNYITPNRQNALLLAVQGYQHNILQSLLKSGADPNKLPDVLCQAVVLYNNVAIRELLDYGAYLNLPSTDIGWTPLMYASESGFLDIMEYLINHGADINYQNADQTALTVAIDNDHIWRASFLIKMGADPNIGWPLIHATQHDQYVITRLLLRDGAQVNARDSSDRTAMDWARQNESDNIMNLLKSFGAEE